MNERRAAGTRRVLRAPPWLIAGILMPLLAAPASAGSVAVLRSSDLGIYVHAAAAFRAAYGAPSLELSLDHADARETVERLRNARPEVVVAIGLRAATLVRDELPRTSMVFCLVPSPARHQLVGSRITGISADIPPALELELLRAAAPDVRKIGVLVGPRSESWVREARAAGERLGLTLRVAKIESIEQLGPQVRELAAETDALWLPADPDVATPEAFRFTLGEALQRRRPLLAFSPGLVRSGAFAAAAPDLEWVGARTAEAVRRIQSGERASDIPVLAIRQVRLVTNLKTARALGRELPGPALTGAEVVR
jgi:putative tryptophan/tyrosine transport system substrate-binding protein